MDAENSKVAARCGCGRIEAHAVIADFQNQGIRGIFEPHADFAGAGVACGVDDRFLGDAASSDLSPASTDKPLIFSEFGADALAGFDDPGLMRKFSETFQKKYYEKTLEMAANAPSVRGLSPWILKDFRSPRRQHPVYQQGWNRKGLVSPTGRRKPAFDVLARFYRDLKAKGR